MLSAFILLDPLAHLSDISGVIKAASQSPLGILALMILTLGALAYYFFRNAGEKAKVTIFALMFFGVALYAYALHDAKTQSTHEIVALPKKPIPISGIVIDSDNNLSIGQAQVYVTESNDGSLSDNNGVFTISLRSDSIGVDSLVHVRVTKDGYKPLIWQVKVPDENLTIPLESSRKKTLSRLRCPRGKALLFSNYREQQGFLRSVRNCSGLRGSVEEETL